jgi:NAD-dependent DNA ligase
MIKIVMPTTCPSCGSDLELVNDQLFCRNQSCPAQSSKKVEHFAKTLKIKGLGPKTIEKLNLTSINEVYEFTEDELVDSLGMALGSKLFEQIQKSKTADLTTLLPAFSIPLIGNSASKKLTSVVTNITELNYDKCVEAGLGPKSCENLIEWLENEYKYEHVFLPFSFQCEEQEQVRSIGKSVCITGKLNDFKNRTLAKDYLESLGFTVTSSVTQKTDYLVDEEGKTSSKSTKAESLGIPITTIKDIIQIEEIKL